MGTEDITIILTYANVQYLIDVGIASLVPLVPVPLLMSLFLQRMGRTG